MFIKTSSDIITLPRGEEEIQSLYALPSVFKNNNNNNLNDGMQSDGAVIRTHDGITLFPKYGCLPRSSTRGSQGMKSTNIQMKLCSVQDCFF